jgi:hypothetical protein
MIEQERNELLQVLWNMVQAHCSGPGGQLRDNGVPANRQALEALEKMGKVVKVEAGNSYFYEWA